MDKRNFNVFCSFTCAADDGKIIHVTKRIGNISAARSRKASEREEYNLRGNVVLDMETRPVFDFYYYVAQRR